MKNDVVFVQDLQDVVVEFPHFDGWPISGDDLAKLRSWYKLHKVKGNKRSK